MGAELGQTTNFKDLIPGAPEQITTITGDLRDANVPLTQFADEAVERLRRGAQDVVRDCQQFI